MFSVLKKISDFAGTRRGLLKKSMAVAFLGAVFAALQFAALMLTLDILVGGADLRIWPVIGVMVVFICPAGWRTERTHGPICWRSITAGQGDLSVSFRMEGLSIWGKAIWQSMS